MLTLVHMIFLQFDAIMFHQRSMSKSDLPNAGQRRPEQYYVMWMMESASYPFGWHGSVKLWHFILKKKTALAVKKFGIFFRKATPNLCGTNLLFFLNSLLSNLCHALNIKLFFFFSEINTRTFSTGQ